MSTSFLGWRAPLIVNTFLAFLSNVFSSSFVDVIMPALYLNTATAQVLIAVMLFLSFNFDSNTSFSLLSYSLSNCYFKPFSFILSISILPKYLYPSSSISFITRPSGRATPTIFASSSLFVIYSHFFFGRVTPTIFAASSLFIIYTHFLFIPHLFNPNSIPIYSLKRCTVRDTVPLADKLQASNHDNNVRPAHLLAVDRGTLY